MTHPHFYENIQGWFNFATAYKDAVQKADPGSVFVEVGSWKGRSAAFMAVEIANSGKEISLHCVDHWQGSDEEAHHSDPDRNNLHAVFLKNMKNAPITVHTHKEDSVIAAGRFKDKSVDFIWIDAGHDYDSVKADILAWWPKLRPGGTMGGDDLPMDGVFQAVTEIFPHYDAGNETGWSWWRVRKGA
jgi:predicted O-methyltransferase YrrM